MKVLYKIFAFITAMTSGIWLIYIAWSHLLGEGNWIITPEDTESLLKFLITLIPAFTFSLWNLYHIAFGNLQEKIKIERQNQVLRKKIEQRELGIKLQELEESYQKRQKDE